MVFTALMKIFPQTFSATQVAGLGEIFVQQKISHIKYTTVHVLVHDLSGSHIE